MPFQSKRTIRVLDIPPGTTKEQYLEFVDHLCDVPEKSGLCGWLKSTTATLNKDTSRETSFALQNGQPVGTVSFLNPKAKEVAMRRQEEDGTSFWKKWTITDDFAGITVLYQHPEEVNTDVCVVHGLGSNAIDAWAATNGKMWPRDFLPSSDGFQKSRIMTFGYDSDLADSRSVMSLDNWGQALLYAINEVRTSEEEKARPLLFVCHSLGGLVARKAMAQLPSTPNIDGLSLSQCGLVFLATPHTGSTKADWADFVVALASVVAGVRTETVNVLKSFNETSVWDKKDFFKLRPRPPPFRCFAEGRKMLVKRTKQHIVTQASASLDSENPAQMIMGSDHRSICKFSNKLGPSGYGAVVAGMSGVLKEVKANRERDEQEQRRQQQQSSVLSLNRSSEKRVSTGEGRSHGSSNNIDLAEEEEALKSLDFISMDYRTSFLSSRVPNINETGSWINHCPDYQEWMTRARGPLWIIGKPGSGKSTLMYCLYRRFERSTASTGGIVLHFFFTSQQVEALQRSEFGMYRTLLHQLLSKAPESLSRFQDLYARRRKTRRITRGEDGEHWHDQERYDLQDFLAEELRRLSRSRGVAIFIDAVDEAFSDAIIDIHAGLRRLDKKLRGGGADIRMCISTRHFPVIPYLQEHSVVMERENRREIEDFITGTFEGANFPRRAALAGDGTLGRLVGELLRRSRGLWLWIYNVLPLILRDLNHAEDYETMLGTMDRTPRDLGQIYSDMLVQIVAPAYRGCAYRLLKWGISHDEPWALVDLGSFVSGRRHPKVLDVETIEVRVGIYTGGLMEVEAREGARHLALFIHPTVKTYLADYGLKRFQARFEIPDDDEEQQQEAAGQGASARHRRVFGHLGSAARSMADAVGSAHTAAASGAAILPMTAGMSPLLDMLGSKTAARNPESPGQEAGNRPFQSSSINSFNVVVDYQESEGIDAKRATNSDEFFEKLGAFLDILQGNEGKGAAGKPAASPGQRRTWPVRVAILDTGLDSTSLGAEPPPEPHRRVWSWDREPKLVDKDGHGTYVASIIRRVDPVAQLYIARVADNRDGDPFQTQEHLARAIRHAVDTWEADIISLGFGFRTMAPALQAALQHAAKHDTIIFAPAGGQPSERRAYPAASPYCIPIHSADVYGNKSPHNPAPVAHDQNFSILGESVEGAWTQGRRVRRSGNSVATAVATGFAALLLRFAGQVLPPERAALVGRRETMRDVLTYLSQLFDGYNYISPGRLWGSDPEGAAEELELVLRRALRH